MKGSRKIAAIPDAVRERARVLYEASTVSVHDIALGLGLSSALFQKARVAWQWPVRPSPRVRRKRQAEQRFPVPDHNAGENAVSLSLVSRLEAQLRRELDAVEAMLAQDPSAVLPATAAEKRARAIASLVRSLGELRRIDVAPAEETGVHDFPASLDELRAQLAQRLDRLRETRRSPSDIGGTEPE